MKKIISLALAAAMTLSMASMAFAANQVGGTAIGFDGLTTDTANGNTIYPVVQAVGPFVYDNEYKIIKVANVEYGDTAYYLLFDANGKLISDSDVVSSMKAKAKWEDGSKLVDGLSIARKRIDNPTGGSGGTDSDGDTIQSLGDSSMIPSVDLPVAKGSTSAGSANVLYGGAPPNFTNNDYNYKPKTYYYMLAVEIKASSSTSDADIIGTVTLNKSKAPKVDDLELDISLNVNWKESYLDKAGLVVDGSISIAAETNYSLKFDTDEEIELEFADDSVFTVDASGQSKLLIYYDTIYNSAVANNYPEADFNFWNGNGAKFNRTGEMFLSAPYDYNVFLYQVNEDGTLSEVRNAEYDDSDEGFYFKTRILGQYVISDMELDLNDRADVSVDVPIEVPTTPPAPVNPSTGAAV